MNIRPPDALLDRFFHRLVRTLRADGVGDLARPFTVGELTAALVPYRAYRNELGTETLQDYEHAVLLLLAGEGERLTCDPATVSLVQRELQSPDPDTSLVRRIASAEARLTSPDAAEQLATQPTPPSEPAVRGTPVTPLFSPAIDRATREARGAEVRTPDVRTPEVRTAEGRTPETRAMDAPGSPGTNTVGIDPWGDATESVATVTPPTVPVAAPAATTRPTPAMTPIPAGIVIPSPTGLVAVPAVPGPLQPQAARAFTARVGSAAAALVPPPPPVPTIVPAPRPSADDLKHAIERLAPVERGGVRTPPAIPAMAVAPGAPAPAASAPPAATGPRTAVPPTVRPPVVVPPAVVPPAVPPAAAHVGAPPVAPPALVATPHAPHAPHASASHSPVAHPPAPAQPHAHQHAHQHAAPRAAAPAELPPPPARTSAGEPIDFRGMRHAPVDIGGVMLLFGLVARDLGLSVEQVVRGSPRADVLRKTPAGQWQRLRTDFELESGDFRDAGRDAGAIELLVCWRDTWPDRPARLQVLELRRVVQHLGARG